MTPAELDARLNTYVKERNLMGLAVQIAKSGSTVYRGNFGLRDYDRKLTVGNDTAFRMASLSKSVTSCGLMLLVEQGKVKLSDSVSTILGLSIVNPAFPTIPITIEMVLSHQSSIQDCIAYDYFLADTQIATSGTQIPLLKDLLVSGGKYYNACLYSSYKPGTYFSYSNLNYVVIGTIIEKLSNTRFDIFMKQNILSKLGTLSFNPADLPNINNLAALYNGLNGVWVATKDNFNGTVKQRNLTGYTIGTNAAIYGPQAHLRATTDQMLRFINMIKNNGIHNGTQILKSTQEIIRPRYQYHGDSGGSYETFHNYGLGLMTTSYYRNDMVLKNRVTIGHTGSGYGLISAMCYSGQYSFSFAVNGILTDYTYNSTSIYQVERQVINNLVDQFISEL